MAQKDLTLKVAEAVQDDVNKGIVRIDTSFMQDIGVRPGDIVEIEGERKTVSLVDRAYPGDIGLDIIRMDGLIRRNAKIGIGETVKVRSIEVLEAKRVVIAPARKGIMIRATSEYFKQGLLGRAIVKGDIVSLGGTSSRRSTLGHSPFEDIFRLLDEEGVMGFSLGDLKFIVAETLPKAPVLITDLTEVVFNPEAVEVSEEASPEVTYEDVGGLREEVTKIREMVELPLKHPEIFEQLGIEPPKGVLLHGPPGTGKTLLAKAVANETNSHFILINGPEIMSKYYGQSEQNLRKKFEEAEKEAPSIIFIDEIDAIATKREETHGEVERRVVAQLLALMDGLKSRGKVVVIAATNVPNLLDPALRRPGRFDREVEIGVPSKEGRLDILKIHTRNMPLYTYETALRELAKEDKKAERMLPLLSLEEIQRALEKGIMPIQTVQKALGNMPKDHGLSAQEVRKVLQKVASNRRVVRLAEIASWTHGFVGADLASLAKESAMIVLRRILPEVHLDQDKPIDRAMLSKLRLRQKDFRDALKVVRPSALREVLVDIPNVAWKDIGGLDNVKQELKEAVEWPLKNPQAFRRLGIRPPRGILLYGPPGTGKTLLAKAVATESEANFILVKGPELLSKWVGESEKAVREVFKKARQSAPTIIFFDEVDSLAPRRGASFDSHVTERVVNQLLTEIDGLEDLTDVIIVAATNRPDIMDTALLRPGRLDRLIYTNVPDAEARLEIFRVHTKNMPLNKDVSMDELVEKTEGYVGADIESVCREAAIMALRESFTAKEVKLKHFEEALKKVAPSVTKEVEETYYELQKVVAQARAKEIKQEKPGYMV